MALVFYPLCDLVISDIVFIEQFHLKCMFELLRKLERVMLAFCIWAILSMPIVCTLLYCIVLV